MDGLPRAGRLISANGVDWRLLRGLFPVDPLDQAGAETKELQPGARTAGARSGGVARRVPSIPGYAITRLIGSGGMGEVFEARKNFPDLGKELTVALKVLSRFNAGDRAAERFLNECRILISLQDVPGIARLYDAGMFNDGGVPRPFYAMEYVRGERTLEQWLREDQRGVREMLRFMADVCDAVHSAHMLGVCHLDLKPVNILCDVLGSPKVIDFGVSRSSEREGEVERALLGTPEYMAPEQAEPRRPVDARSDVYAIGVILYEVVTGRRPYPVDRGTREKLLASIVHAEIERPRRRDGVPVPERLARIILKAMEKDPARRHATALELAKELRGYLIGSASLGRGAWGWSALAGLAACTAAVFAWEKALPPLTNRFVHAPYSQWVMLNLPFASSTGLADRVRVVSFDDETSFAALGEAYGIEGVRDNVPWTRRSVFALALDRLRGAGARAVGFDLNFKANPDAAEADALLAQSIRELSAVKTPVVVACTECVPMGGPGLPQISEVIVTAARRWGDVDFSPDWFMPLAISESPDAPFARLSLPLMCVLSAERPDEFPRGRFDPDTQTLTYWWEAGGRSGLTQPTTSARAMRLKTQRVSPPGGEGESPRVDGIILLVDMPAMRELDSATIRIDDYLAASPAQLKSWCGGRFILFGNTRSDAADLFDHPRGDKIHGVYAHAAAIDRLVTGRYARLPSALGDDVMYATAGVGAMGLFFPAFGGLLRRAGLIALLSVLCVSAGLLTYLIAGWIIDVPGLVFVTMVTGVLGLGWHVFVRREIGL